MYTRILVPLDGSDLASAALPHVRELVRCTHAGVSLLQVTPAPIHSINTMVDANAPRWSGIPARTMNSVNWQIMSQPVQRTEWIEHEVEAAQNYLDVVASELKEAGIQARTLVRPDGVTQTILDTAKSERADLIVMTTHGRSGIGRFLLGSVADRVVHYATIPVLLVRSNAFINPPVPDRTSLYQRILVPLDGSALSSAVLNDVRELALCTNAEVLLLNVIPEKNDWAVGDVAFGLSNGLINLDSDTGQPAEFSSSADSADTLKARRAEHIRETAQHSLSAAAADLKRAGVRVETLLQQGSPAETILEVADNCHADLIAMATHGRSGLSRFLMGSVARQIIEHARVPVLVVRATVDAASSQTRLA